MSLVDGDVVVLSVVAVVEGDLVVPLEKAPDDLKQGMGQSFELRQKNREILQQQEEQ